MATKDTSLFVKRDATFSPCRRYRYTLTIVWDDSKPLAAFIGLNPSTADEVQDDPTIRRCRDFAALWGCGGMVMLNLFAFRATDPNVMKAEREPIGEGNTLVELVTKFGVTGPLVAAWGKHGRHLDRGAQVKTLFSLTGRDLQCLGLNKDGSPKHPLYLAKVTKLQPLEVVL
ncbi:DUF1643 domain-containing protein [Terriglobus albidus]|uniref:DUF1643 domain-containing protein n=1 Tax=Terriglobus albidus TaxID=1592106 RepID=UPI0021E0A146|nr:DUF1643 domain-containing protein [Terriglobus albidus]